MAKDLLRKTTLKEAYLLVVSEIEAQRSLSEIFELLLISYDDLLSGHEAEISLKEFMKSPMTIDLVKIFWKIFELSSIVTMESAFISSDKNRKAELQLMFACSNSESFLRIHHYE